MLEVASTPAQAFSLTDASAFPVTTAGPARTLVPLDAIYDVFASAHADLRRTELEFKLAAHQNAALSRAALHVSDATSFNQPLNNWNVSNVRSMLHMFYGANSFNQPLNKWNVSNVTDVFGMFNGATSFNQTLHAPDQFHARGHVY